jgi:hypothetical protein
MNMDAKKKKEFEWWIDILSWVALLTLLSLSSVAVLILIVTKLI